MINKGKVYKDGFVKISNNIALNIPTIGEIFDFDENKYYSIVTMICSTGFDYKWQLHKMGIDFTRIRDYDLFLSLIVPSLTKDDTQLIFGDKLDFSKMRIIENKNTNEKTLVQIYDEETVFIIDYVTYSLIVNHLREIHGLKRNFDTYKKGFEEVTKRAEIEDAELYYLEHKDDEPKPYLQNLVSAMVNCADFPRDDKTVYDMNIYAFMDSVNRIQKSKNANLLLQSAYSGFGISLKDVNKKELNWLGEI